WVVGVQPARLAKRLRGVVETAEVELPSGQQARACNMRAHEAVSRRGLVQLLRARKTFNEIAAEVSDSGQIPGRVAPAADIAGALCEGRGLPVEIERAREFALADEVDRGSNPGPRTARGVLLARARIERALQISRRQPMKLGRTQHQAEGRVALRQLRRRAGCFRGVEAQDYGVQCPQSVAGEIVDFAKPGRGSDHVE